MRSTLALHMIECHAAGEVGNVIVGGVGDIPGDSMFDKRLYLEAHCDQLRKLLLFEPRGGPVHNANIVLPSSRPDTRLGYVILESTEYPAMSGSNTICVATALLETGMVPMQEPLTRLTLEAPAGVIGLECACCDGKVTSVRFTNQPAFVHHLAASIEISGLGSIVVDVAWGGMTYALADARSLGFSLTPDEARHLCELGQSIKTAAAEQLDAVHPEEPRFAGVTQTEFVGPVHRENGTLVSRNAVVVSPGRLDRSPCGTGTSARLAVMHARGELAAGESFVHESVIGTRFDARIESVTSVRDKAAIVPSVAGEAWITGIRQLLLDPSDPFPEGFTLSDSWMTTV